MIYSPFPKHFPLLVPNRNVTAASSFFLIFKTAVKYHRTPRLMHLSAFLASNRLYKGYLAQYPKKILKFLNIKKIFSIRKFVFKKIFLKSKKNLKKLFIIYDVVLKSKEEFLRKSI